MDRSELEEALWNAIAQVRDAAPRAYADADTNDVVAACMPTIERYVAARTSALKAELRQARQHRVES